MPFCTKCGNKLEDDDVFCGVCGTAVPLTGIVGEGDEDEEPEPVAEPEPAAEAEPAAKPEPKAAEPSRESQVKRCPACGEVVSLNDFVCKACGHELRRVTDGSINDLYRRLEQLEAARTKDEGETKDGIPRTDALKANAIRYFPIPNTKQDLLEFLVMAKANSQESDSDYEEVVLEAWKSKFDQAYDKAEALFGEDEDFSKFEKIKGRSHENKLSGNAMKLVMVAIILGVCLVACLMDSSMGLLFLMMGLFLSVAIFMPSLFG